MEMFIVLLKYNVMFNDADDGWCYAGDGGRILKCFSEKGKAEEFIATFDPIIKLAEKEHTVFPRQANNRKLKSVLGWDLHDFNQCEEGYNLELQTVEVE